MRRRLFIGLIVASVLALAAVGYVIDLVTPKGATP
jgi:branched-subunit amino acid ABC-type transport system permease component